MSDMLNVVDKDYVLLIRDIKHKVQAAQFRARYAVNLEMIMMYWSIGKELLARQKLDQWGSDYLGQLSKDLMLELPGVKGFSTTNLKRMRAFAELYPDIQIGAQAVPQLPWGSIVLLIQKVKDDSLRNWYAEQAVKEGWSRNFLSAMIKSQLHLSQQSYSKATNFKRLLPSQQSELADDLFKDPYHLGFLNLTQEDHERDIEKGLVANIRDFLLRLGKGYAFMGSQYKIVVGGDEFFIDMLFFNANLNAYVVIELKAEKFSPADVGQLGFYVKAVDKTIKQSFHNETIGILLCESKNEIVAQYSLEVVDSPMGISQYELGQALTQHLKIHRK